MASCLPVYLQKAGELIRLQDIVGVTYGDLPLIGSRSTEAMTEYSQLPVLRKLEWRLDEQGEPMRRPLKDVISQTAAFAQTRGSEAPDPCYHCKTKQSVWQTCVVGFDTHEGTSMHGSCASCRFSRRYCTLGHYPCCQQVITHMVHPPTVKAQARKLSSLKIHGLEITVTKQSLLARRRRT
ncbi:hypothetical protein BO70DRAFT_196191 [Aspergillus heteromorphus CBS 117.55]|uniref:Uncharacterized protein n=1 Tax=Aspergillus heteromorphus CBS 117.55 TaxID=1448321 RepID=A0A317WQH0_9EURO|nr:uncharacterized protein BO70DRAFT_196191 [Aspergillus heteromorphus CBS 117.55]PWY87532.1 hypothetical protein BO70DRAFT_196191 [Aspergillus heteromorphus CBS 117.55]